MKRSRSLTLALVITLLTIGALVVFAVQNRSPVLPLTVLGWRSPAYPLSVWLIGALTAGALTTLLLEALSIGATPRRRSGKGDRDRWSADGASGPNAYVPGDSYRSSYDSGYDTSASAARDQSTPRETDRRSRYAGPVSGNRDDADWGSYRPRETWSDWDQPPEPTYGYDSDDGAGYGPNGASDYRSSASAGVRRDRQKDAVNSAINDIEQGWEDYADEEPPRGDSETAGYSTQIPDDYPDYPGRTVYPDGSIYDNPSYSDRDYSDSGYGDSDYGDSGYSDRGYGEPDYSEPDYSDPDYGSRDYDASDYGNSDYERDRDIDEQADAYTDTPASTPEEWADFDWDDEKLPNAGPPNAETDGEDVDDNKAEAGDRDGESGTVYDAEYRVIIPPYRGSNDPEANDDR